jgi:hypothetical protein
MSGTASPLEISWTVVACLGLLFSGWLALDGYRDLSAVLAAIRAVPPKARRWGPRWYVALSALVANAAFCLVWAGFIVIGLIAMRFPPPAPNPGQSVSNMWAGWVLLGMEVLLAGVQAWHLFVRDRIEQATRRAP